MSDLLTVLRTALADHYAIEREIGAGGMATVYLAHDLKHDRDVAIRALHPDLDAALGGERFLTRSVPRHARSFRPSFRYRLSRRSFYGFR